MLKSLELFGFKSFADRTRFDFAPGITGVVGPNGSGKSNVVDALKWILGDQSAKSLRGKEMTDVIFNGAAGRKGSSFAEATLTFDNSTGLLPIDAQEVHIGRRIWRSGDAEYLINREPSRLKDVRDLFMGTGAGASAYCIIEQGRVDQILQSNASARRMVFEEAAGISRYKARKIDALRKLERVDQNVLRLKDIVDEVEAQLTATRNQAAKATKFRQVAGELKELWIGLAADDHRRLSSQISECEQDVARWSREADVCANQQLALDEQLTRLDSSVNDVEDRLRVVERQHSANRQAMATHAATIQHQQARQTELESEIHRLRRQRATMHARVGEVVGERDHNKAQLNRFEGEFEKLKKQVTDRAAQLDALHQQLAAGRVELDSRRERLLAGTHELSAAGARVTELLARRQAVESEAAKLADERDARQRTLAESRARHDRKQRLVDEQSRRVEIADERIRDLGKNRALLTGQQADYRRRVANLREQRSAAQARRLVLEELERKQEGFGISVKEILQLAETSDQTPWNQIRGSVADLLEADLEHAAIVDVALAGRSQLIVIDELDPLAALLRRGQLHVSGRVGFIVCPRDVAVANADGRTPRGVHFANGNGELESDSDGGAAWPNLSGWPGIVARADQFVRAAPAVAGLSEHLLADTWIVESLDVAIELVNGAGRNCRFVTLQGELLESRGELHVGMIHGETALLSRKSELRRLKSDIARLDRQTEEDERRAAGLDDSVTVADHGLSAAQLERETRSRRLAQLTSALAAQQREVDQLERGLAELEESHSRLERQAAEIDGLREAADRQVEAARTGLSVLQSEIDAEERQIAALDLRARALEQHRAAEQVDLAKQEERLLGLRSAFQRLERDLEQRVLQRDEAERRLAAGSIKCREIGLQILNAGAELAELHLVEEQLTLAAHAVLKQRDALRAERAESQARESVLRGRRNEVNDLRHQGEIRARDLRHELTSLAARIDEEYQLSLEEMVASGASALRAFFDARRTVQLRNADDGADGPEKSIEPSDASGVSLDAQTDSIAERDADEIQSAREEIESEVQRLRRKLKMMGNVNTDSLQDLDELEQRFGHLSTQLQDLVSAKSTLEEIVRRINVESKRLFTETFDGIRVHFQELFRKLFGGGEGDIILEDGEDVLECGIDIVARPPGKELRSISLLSGGEKTLTAVALLLAIFRSRPSPFCILDEVDAALDEANIDRFVNVLRDFQESTQFIMITHSKRSMTVADVLYGVTMEQSGVSKRMSVRFEDVRENGEFTTDPRAALGDAA